VIIFFQAEAFAQRIDIHWDNEVGSFKNQETVLLGTHASTRSFYLLVHRDEKYFIQEFNEENKKVLDKELKFSSFEDFQNNSFAIQKIFMLKDRFVALILGIDQKKSLAKFIVQDIAFNGDLLLARKPVLSVNSALRASYHMAISPDQHRIVFCLAIPKQKNNKENKLTVKIFDEELVETSTREISFGAEENEKYKWIQIENILVSNNDNIYLLGNKFLNAQTEDCSLWLLKKDGESLKKFALELTGKIPKKCDIEWNALNEPLLVGLFAVKDEVYHHYTGYFYGKIVDLDETIDLKTGFIPNEVQHPPHSSDDYFPDWKILNREDGGVTFILEYVYLKGNNYHFGNLLMVSIDSRGLLNYAHAVFKNQMAFMAFLREKTYLTYYSYLPFIDESRNKLIVFFNDTPKNNPNVNEKSGAYLTNIDNSLLTKIEIDPTGHLSKTIVSTPDNNAIALCGGISARYSDKEHAVFGFKNDALWLGKIIME
jgi:hypothetical protein